MSKVSDLKDLSTGFIQQQRDAEDFYLDVDDFIPEEALSKLITGLLMLKREIRLASRKPVVKQQRFVKENHSGPAPWYYAVEFDTQTAAEAFRKATSASLEEAQKLDRGGQA